MLFGCDGIVIVIVFVLRRRMGRYSQISRTIYAHSRAPRHLLCLRCLPLEICMCYNSPAIHCLVSHQPRALPSTLCINIARAPLDSQDGLSHEARCMQHMDLRVSAAAVQPSYRVALHVAPLAISSTQSESERIDIQLHLNDEHELRGLSCVATAWYLPVLAILPIVDLTEPATRRRSRCPFLVSNKS